MKKFLWAILFLGLFVVSGLLFNLGFEVVRAIAAPFGAVILQSWTGSNMAAVDSSHRLSVSCDNGCGTTSTATDEGTFTQGSSGYTPVGGMYATSVTALTAGQGGAARLTSDRKLITMPYGAMDNMVRGTGNTTGTGATTIISAPGSGSIYVTSVQCFRTDNGSTAEIATLNDTVSTPVGVPGNTGGSGSNPVYGVPLKVAATTALTFTMGSGVTTAYCNAQGFVAP